MTESAAVLQQRWLQLVADQPQPAVLQQRRLELVAEFLIRPPLLRPATPETAGGDVHCSSDSVVSSASHLSTVIGDEDLIGEFTDALR